jgi:hypothetical protein
LLQIGKNRAIPTGWRNDDIDLISLVIYKYKTNYVYEHINLISGEKMEPTNLQIFVAEVKGTGESEYMGVYKQVPLRLRAGVFAEVEALQEMMARTQKVSRNKVINDLLEIAIDQVKGSLDEKSLQDFNMFASQHYNDFTGSGDLSDD